jgi:hypothetical protein
MGPIRPAILSTVINSWCSWFSILAICASIDVGTGAGSDNNGVGAVGRNRAAVGATNGRDITSGAQAINRARLEEIDSSASSIGRFLD